MTSPRGVERQLVGSAPWNDDHVHEILGAIRSVRRRAAVRRARARTAGGGVRCGRGLQPAITLVPRLCASLRASGSASDALVRAMLGAAIEQLGRESRAWGPTLRELGFASPRPLD